MILLLCCSIFNAEATVFVSGSISANTTWTKANSPYIVNGNLTVDSGVILTIQPGVTVQIDTSMQFSIDGRLIAEGLVTDSIIFTSNPAIPSRFKWPGLSFRIKARNDTSRFKYCIIEHANIGIYNAGSSMFVSNSVIRYNSEAVFLAPPSLPTNCYNAINKCLITQNGRGVRDAQNTPVPGLLSENDITYNDGTGYFTQSSSKGMVMNNNNFFYNHIGVWLEGDNVRGLHFNTFKGSASTGLHIEADTIYTPVSNNLFIYNDSAISLIDVMAASVTNNTFAYNNVGISHNQNSVNLPNPSGMVISNNCITKNVNYDFTENGTVDFQAPNNWWGDTAITHIDSFIYDYYDNISLAEVSYLPILTNASGCQAVTPPPPCVAPAGISWLFAGSDVIFSWNSVPGARLYEYFLRFLHTPTPPSGIDTKNTSVIYNNVLPGKYLLCVRTHCWQLPFFSEWSCDTLEVPTSITTLQQVPQPRIYPNPSNGIFMADIPATMQAGEATVLDVNGRVIARQTYTPGSTLKFELGNIAKGIYVVQFTNASATLHAKLTLQ